MSNRLTGDFRKFMDKNYLGSWDVPDGEDLVLTIDHVEQNDVKNERGSERKLTIHFAENGYKPMILNTTNAKRIGKVAGSNKVENWENLRIAIYTERVQAFGGMTDALRVREYPPRETEATCEECGQTIRPVMAGNDKYSVNKIVELSRGKYGKCLCWDCSMKMKAKEAE